MAATNIKPEVAIAKTDSETLTNISKNREAVRKTGVHSVEEKARGKKSRRKRAGFTLYLDLSKNSFRASRRLNVFAPPGKSGSDD
ncbi:MULTISPECIES: hypothetical protein [Lelliottia]|uniref:Uncharacterized protein n=1 Tax=Lelliottia wanjuensis TaxID=3050585 RepID=A0AAP4D5X7_9ENTR|nr:MULTISPECIES: hypothetical protein [unclassified Lelliottia]MDK9357366.1 hypothetical protein [Lelliottia sp. V106_16]MDK9362263.1 hypothetical protein [Lelliottia sp. V106_12]MDK9373142.1 hypothetical protein [Lelliottia sp. V106_10]MDK9586562.1 hypothetical protein [Lelliottia sp. V86_10]MDK9599946.1 hypothetical protein [Lelliottia sp. V106_5]